MNVTQRGIITLLKSAVTEQPLPLPEGFDLEAAYPLLKRHHMSTLIYDGAVRCGIPRTQPVMQKLFQSYCRVLMISERQMEEVARVFAAFDENNIDYMPLKGCLMKERYPKPELRIMGDADVLIRMEQYDRIVPIMEKLGFHSKVGTDRELVWVSDDLYLELHKRLFSIDNRVLYGYMGDGWKLACSKEHTRYAMSSEHEFIYMLTHVANHICTGGIGCRHAADLWVFLRTHPDLDEAYVLQELSKLKLDRFYDNIRRMLSVWFEDAPEDAVSEMLTQFFMSAGSWGTSVSKALSIVALNTMDGATRRENRMKYIVKTVFPGVVVLRAKYPVLQKAPWLLPLVWMYRPFYKLVHERKDLCKHLRNFGAVQKDSVDEKRIFLDTIGLYERL